MKHYNYSLAVMEQYARTHTDPLDWTHWEPRCYQRLTNSWGRKDRIDTLLGTWYAPDIFHGEFLLVYPEGIAPNGRTRYHVYLHDLYSDDTHDLWHEECTRLTDLHHLGFRRIAWDALPPGCQRIFATEWDDFIQDFTRSLSA